MAKFKNEKKMRPRFYKIFFAFVFALVTVQLSAQDGNTQLWEKANAFYSTQDYKQAISTYEQILRTGQTSAKLYFNLGNAYFKSGDYNKAILFYERAKLLAPNDDNIDFNLAFANQYVVTKLEPLPQPFFIKWRSSVINKYPSNTWAHISIWSFILFLTLAGLFIFSRIVMVRRIAFISGIIFFVFSAFTFSFASKQKEKLTGRSGAIVFCPRATVKSAPSATSTDLFLIYEGLKVEVTDSIGTWREIKLADGNEGWLPDSCIVKI